MLLHNDCLVELRKMLNGSVDMVYLDPPFFTQKKQKGISKQNEHISFDDTWKDINEYIDFLKERLFEIKRILKKCGSLFFHCDKCASHHIRIALDEVFGIKNFQSEIIWTYRRWSNSKRGLLNSHQTIYFYSKSNEFKFNTIFAEYSPTTNIDQILQQRERDKNGRCVYKKASNGEIEKKCSKKGVPLSDVWEIPFLNPKAKERIGYPTQKPVELLERIIEISTNENDLIVDPFCGSGTALVAAKLNNRRFIGIDISQKAIEIASKRLEKPFKTKSLLLENGLKKYETKTLEEQDLLRRLGAIIVQRNSGIDGFVEDKLLGKFIAIKLQRHDESIYTACEKLIKAAKSKGCDKRILIKLSNTVIMNFFDEQLSSGVKIVSREDVDKLGLELLHAV